MIKSGNFYKVYGKDAYVVANLFKYAIKEEQGIITCGFPTNAIKKIETKLENKKINYIVIDKRNNYSIDEKIEFKNLNSYNKEYELSKIYVKNIKRINAIYEYLVENSNNENLKNILKEFEEIINAKGKI